MASRQGGPGRADAPGTGSAERPNAPYAETPGPTRIGPTIEGPRTFEPVSPATDVPDADPGRRPAAVRTPEDPPIRDPGLYALTDHFRERLGQPGRYVSTRTVSDAIRDGQLRWNRTDGWRFAFVEDGIRFVVVVSDTETNSPVVVTAWTEVADRGAALASARWDATDVDTIAVRTALSDDADEPIPDRLRRRSISRPFEIGDHRLETVAGEPFVRCTACGCRFRSKSALIERRCRPRSGGR
ncbi:hypothetical protein [Halorubrum sp. JWXQ-INN 858]|uniref:hypothetical protein n=1 Tax=Halorubrum sp. JWXQ-INN 858 TaxID=2690782 RepID=UPI001F19390E|nr:hypothetical protein [Halorubrum sp. JWXQ-INN 858]